MALTTTKATAVGLMAPALWAMSVGLVRTVTVEAGIAGGGVPYESDCRRTLDVCLRISEVFRLPEKVLSFRPYGGSFV